MKLTARGVLRSTSKGNFVKHFWRSFHEGLLYFLKHPERSFQENTLKELHGLPGIGMSLNGLVLHKAPIEDPPREAHLELCEAPYRMSHGSMAKWTFMRLLGAS